MRQCNLLRHVEFMYIYSVNHVSIFYASRLLQEVLSGCVPIDNSTIRIIEMVSGQSNQETMQSNRKCLLNAFFVLCIFLQSCTIISADDSSTSTSTTTSTNTGNCTAIFMFLLYIRKVQNYNLVINIYFDAGPR